MLQVQFWPFFKSHDYDLCGLHDRKSLSLNLNNLTKIVETDWFGPYLSYTAKNSNKYNPVPESLRL